MDVIASLSLVFDILARDKASSEFKKVGDAAESAGKRGGGAMSSLAGSLKTVGAVFAGSAIVAGLGKTISAASDLNETVNKSNVIFGSNAREIQKWASGASKNLGLSKGAAMEAAAGFGNMFTQLGFTGKAATGMSEQVVQLSADLGSFNNLPTADVADMMSAAFRGEYDSLQRLIPNINAARVEQVALATTGKESAKQLTAQEKAAAVLAIVQKDGAAAAGDFAKTSDGLANSSKIAAAQFEDLQAEIGQKFLPAAQGAMHFVSETAIPAVSAFADGAFSLAGAFADLPGPVKLAAAAGVAWAIAGDKIMSAWGPVRGAFGGLRGTMSSFGEALGYARANGDGLGTVLRSTASYAGGQAIDAFKRLGRAIGPELGIGVAVATIGYLVEGYKQLTQASDDAKAAAEGLAGALTLTDRAADMKAVRSAIESTEGLVEALAKAGVSSEDAIAGLLGQEDAHKRVTRAIQEYMSTRPSLNGGNPELNAARTAMLGYDELATSYGNAAGNARFFGSEAGKAADAADAAAAPTSWLDRIIGRVGAIADEAAGDVKDLSDELRKLRGGSVDAAEAQIDLYDAIRDAKSATDDLSGSVTTSNGKLNKQSEAGGAAYRALVDVADASNDVIGSMREQGKSAEQMAKRDQELRVSFIKTAMQMGIGQKEARKLADEILGVPKERNTKINTDTRTANRNVNNLQDDIDGMHGKTLTVTVKTTRDLAKWAAENGINTFSRAGYAEGGYTGPGGKYDVAGFVHAGEYVLTKERTAKLGLSTLENLEKILPGYAGGGAVRSINVVIDNNELPKAIAGAIGATIKNNAYEAGTGMVGALNWAKTQVGKPYIWGSAGPSGYDCSGFMAALVNVIRGRNPYSRLGSTATMPWSGFRSGMFGGFQVGNSRDTGGGIGHMAGTLMGVNVESAGGVGVRMGRSARGANSSIFGEHYSMAYDRGGLLPPGLTLAYNGTGRHETIRTAEQERALHRPINIIIDGPELARIVRVEADDAAAEALVTVVNRGQY